MEYYKQLNIEDLNKERERIGGEDLSKWDKGHLVQFLYCIKKIDFEAFFDGYSEFEAIQKGD